LQEKNDGGLIFSVELKWHQGIAVLGIVLPSLMGEPKTLLPIHFTT
jgi:hypothetical protein